MKIRGISKLAITIGIIIVILAAVGAIYYYQSATAPPQVSEAVHLKLVTFGTGTGWYVMGGALSDVLTDVLPSGSTIDVLPYAGGVSNPILVANKSADMGLAFSTTAKWAYDGTGPYSKKYTNLRIIAAGLDIYWVAMGVRSDTDLRTIDDIINPKHPIVMGTGPKGSLSEFSFRQILEAYGMTYDDLTAKGVKIVHAGMKSLKTQLQNRQLDGIVWVVTPGHPSWTELFINPGMRFIPLPPEVRNYLIDKYGYAESQIPANLFQNSNQADAVSMSTILIVRDDMPNSLAYTMIKTMVENRDKLVSAYPAMKRWDPSKISQDATIPVHDGAAQFYKEKGYM